MADRKPAAASDDIGPIVASGHLARGAMPALSEFEFGLTMLNHAFSRWIVRCMAAAGVPDLSPIDVIILHNVNHRGKPKRQADICLVLNIEDTHIVTYAVRKLERLKLVRSEKRGKEKLVAITPAGEAACERYAAIREEILVTSLLGSDAAGERLSATAQRIRLLSGFYDQACRAAASL